MGHALPPLFDPVPPPWSPLQYVSDVVWTGSDRLAGGALYQEVGRERQVETEGGGIYGTEHRQKEVKPVLCNRKRMKLHGGFWCVYLCPCTDDGFDKMLKN